MKLLPLLLLSCIVIPLLVAACGSAPRADTAAQPDGPDAYSGATSKAEQTEAQPLEEPAGDAGVQSEPPGEGTE
jgi:hypothetical protein